MALSRRPGRPAAAPGRPAVFIDKDGTLIHDVPYNVDVEQVRLRRDAGPALAALQQAGYALVLISNQSGIALDLFDEAELEAVWAAIRQQLARHGAGLDAIYYCPHHPHGVHPRYSFACDCRKPRPGLLYRAAIERGFDLSRSWLIGDILDDVEAGRRAGCRTILLDVGSETEWLDSPWRHPDCVVSSLCEAAACIAAHAISAEIPAWTA